MVDPNLESPTDPVLGERIVQGMVSVQHTASVMVSAAGSNHGDTWILQNYLPETVNHPTALVGFPLFQASRQLQTRSTFQPHFELVVVVVAAVEVDRPVRVVKVVVEPKLAQLVEHSVTLVELAG